MKRLFFIVIAVVFAYPSGYYIFQKNPDFVDTPKNTPIKNGQITAYVINLDRCKDRYSYVKDKVQHLNIPHYRISAIDGKNLTQEAFEKAIDLKSYKKFMGHFPNVGTVGCSLSHIKAWTLFLNSNSEFGLFFEDDVTFDPKALQEAINHVVGVKDLWDVNTFIYTHGGAPITRKKLPNGRNLSLFLTEIADGGCYIMNRKAARVMLEKALPIVAPIDHYFTRPWEFGLVFTGIEKPNIVSQSFGTSEIKKTSSLISQKKSLLGAFQKAHAKLQSYVIRIIYNVKIYLLG